MTNGPSAGVFAAGSLLLTSQGEQRVESLSPGDQLVTIRADGPPLRTIASITAHLCAAPYRIRAGAFAPNMPARDLVLSGDHAIYADGALFKLADLGNGISIRPEPASLLTGYRVMLDGHDVVLAEGLPVESSPRALKRAVPSLDAKIPDTKIIVLYPALEPRCLPMFREGDELQDMRRMLKNRLGHDRERKQLLF